MPFTMGQPTLFEVVRKAPDVPAGQLSQLVALVEEEYVPMEQLVQLVAPVAAE